MKAVTLAFLLALAAPVVFAERVTVPLNGPWQIGESVAAEPAPRAFPSTVAVPGLVHNATPAFPEVDAFDSLELVNNKISQKLLPESARVTAPGVSHQKRNYFWYRRTFRAPAREARPCCSSARRSSARPSGSTARSSASTPAASRPATSTSKPAIRWDGENTLVIRIGAHPAVLPDTYPDRDRTSRRSSGRPASTTACR